MEQEMDKVLLKGELKHRLPVASGIPFEEGDNVIFWREKHFINRIVECLGPYTVNSVESRRKELYAKDTDVGTAFPFGVAKVNQYLTNEDAARSFFLNLRHSTSTFRSKDDREDAYLTEAINDKDPRPSSKEMTESKRRENSWLTRARHAQDRSTRGNS